MNRRYRFARDHAGLNAKAGDDVTVRPDELRGMIAAGNMVEEIPADEVMERDAEMTKRHAAAAAAKEAAANGDDEGDDEGEGEGEGDDSKTKTAPKTKPAKAPVTK